jgi:hypothetical protein
MRSLTSLDTAKDARAGVEDHPTAPRTPIQLDHQRPMEGAVSEEPHTVSRCRC